MMDACARCGHQDMKSPRSIQPGEPGMRMFCRELFSTFQKAKHFIYKGTSSRHNANARSNYSVLDASAQ
ncbi:unnamed protein product [Acanthoscelides obtectus]|uniref:Uncharacterized protein n=1 Tax=Acanthoscelides obtectus TaxID=200917 RepID=A0A9P0LCG4_ACAOB|nr:unnamed protein product [Acanthoscelides obtectus]CAK1662791.1 hypothetical protein AOBTE_LOCUS23318 [Acanthoscelides obtectus]